MPSDPPKEFWPDARIDEARQQLSEQQALQLEDARTLFEEWIAIKVFGFTVFSWKSSRGRWSEVGDIESISAESWSRWKVHGGDKTIHPRHPDRLRLSVEPPHVLTDPLADLAVRQRIARNGIPISVEEFAEALTAIQSIDCDLSIANYQVGDYARAVAHACGAFDPGATGHYFRGAEQLPHVPDPWPRSRATTSELELEERYILNRKQADDVSRSRLKAMREEIP